MKITLLIDSVDRTSILVEESWDLVRSSGSVMDITNLTLDDQNNNISVVKGKELIIEKFGDNTVRHFGGILTAVNTTPLGIGRLINLTSQDWKVIFDKATVTKNYTNKTDKFIIEDSLTEAGITEITTSDFVEVGRTIDQLNLQGVTLRHLMDVLTEITGFIWDIDSFKKLIYRPASRVSATFEFSDTPDSVFTFPYYNVSRDEELGSYNVVEVVGAEDLSSDVQDIYAGDGSRKVFHIQEVSDRAAISHAPSTSDRVEIQKNTGTNGSPIWTTQTVGLEQQDSLSVVDVIWNPGVLRVEFASAPPNFTNSWRIKGRYVAPIRVELKDQDSIDILGREYKKVIVEPSIKDKNTATDVAIAFLNEQGDKDTLEFDFDHDGMETDVVTRLESTVLGIASKLYLVEELRTRLLGGEIAMYSAVISAGPKLL